LGGARPEAGGRDESWPGSSSSRRASQVSDYFVLKAGNGEIIAQSEQYTTKSAAKHGIESVQKTAPAANTYHSLT
jgi:uncharacterized protein YegP (UPF0339 family)